MSPLAAGVACPPEKMKTNDNGRPGTGLRKAGKGKLDALIGKACTVWPTRGRRRLEHPPTAEKQQSRTSKAVISGPAIHSVLLPRQVMLTGRHQTWLFLCLAGWLAGCLSVCLSLAMLVHVKHVLCALTESNRLMNKSRCHEI